MKPSPARREQGSGHLSPLRVLVIITVFTLVLAACAGSTPDQDTAGAGDGTEGAADVEEMVWTLPETFSNLQATADTWNEQNPDRPVRLELLPPGADEQRQQLFLVLNAQDPDFDILGLDVIWTGEFVENGWLEPMTDVRSEITEQLIPGAVESATYQDELWAIPYISGAGMLYYRSDLVDTPPETWDELKEVGLRVAEEEDIAAYAAQGAKYEGMVVNYLEFFWSAGGELFNDDQSEVLFGTQGAAERATEFMAESMQDGFFAPGFNTMMEEEARNLFQSGDAVFMRNWPYAYPLMKEEGAVADQFDIAPLPTFDGEGTISAVGGVNNAISAFSEHKEDAKDFAMFAATDPDMQRTLALEFSQVPVLESIFPDLTDDPVFEVLEQVVPEARARPPVPTYNEISQAIQENIFAAYNGEADIEAAIDAVADVMAEATGG